MHARAAEISKNILWLFSEHLIEWIVSDPNLNANACKHNHE